MQTRELQVPTEAVVRCTWCCRSVRLHSPIHPSLWRVCVAGVGGLMRDDWWRMSGSIVGGLYEEVCVGDGWYVIQRSQTATEVLNICKSAKP